MQRITKAKARKLYESGKNITLNPSKMFPGGVWSMAIETNKERCNDTFDALVNSYSYYNCTNETGNVVHFYIA